MIDTKAIRTKLLDLAIQGKLTEQKAEDGTSFELYEALQKSRTELEKIGVIKKRKPLDEIKEKEKTIPIPVSWKWVRLGELIVSISGGKSFKCLESMPDDNQMGVVKVSAVTWGTFQQNESKTCLSADMWNEDYRIKSGDFLISRSNTDEFVVNCVIVLMFVSLISVTFLAETSLAFTNNAYQPYYSGNKNSNCVSLMFNVYMGTEYIDGILEELKNANAKATFFVGGCWVGQNVHLFFFP